MSESSRVIVYTDYKSPYAFLAKDLAYGLERDLRVRVEWRPYLLDLASRYGSARVDANGRVLEENRDPHQWRRVRYSYMDCRRQARETRAGDSWHAEDLELDIGFGRHAVRAARRRCGVPPLPRHGVRALLAACAGHRGHGCDCCRADRGGRGWGWIPCCGAGAVRRSGRDQPGRGGARRFRGATFVVDGELFWGSEHLPDIRAILAV